MLRAGMNRANGRRAAVMAACAVAALALFWSGSAHAQGVNRAPDYASVLQQIDQQEQRLNAQERLLAQQQRQIAEQRDLIQRQRRQIEAMAGAQHLADADLGEMTGAGVDTGDSLAYTPLDPDQPISTRRRPYVMLAQAEGGSAPQTTAAPQAAAPSGPVGEAPPEQHHASVEALPEGSTALLGRGRLTLEPSIEYANSSSNRLVFHGVEIVTGINIGLIEASDTARDTVASTFAARYAVTDRLEVEARIPYVYRHDRITTLAQNNATVTQTYDLDGAEFGDLEASVRYQLNRPKPGGVIYVAGARIKSTTGRGPFDVKRDASGVATELATGSGFWGVQGSMSVLYPSDPVVLYANVSYLYNFDQDVNRDIGQTHVGDVDPGDSIGFGFGMGFALNPRFSYSLGYSHSYITPTETEINGTHQQSTSLQVGALQFGMSFRARPNLTLATSVDVGVTQDAPDIRIALRTPFTF